MVGQRTSQVRKMVGMQTGSRQAAFMRVMLCLALFVLIAGTASTEAARHEDESAPSQWVYVRLADSIQVSNDAGVSWTQAGALLSRPLTMAVAERTSSPGTPGLVFVGTESRGLLRSHDGGSSWQPVDSTVLSGGYAAPIVVTVLAVDPEDDQIVYAATNIWLGTNTAHLNPVGVAVSVDGGRQWLEMSRAQVGAAPLQRLEPVAGRPLTVQTIDGTGNSNRINLELSPELLVMLQDIDPAIRASAARAIGLISDPAALPGLMQALADPDPLAGHRIAEAIGRIDDRSVSAALLNVLGSAPAPQFTRAALALGMLKSTEAVPGLTALLSTGDPEAQRVAAGALATIGTPTAMDALMAPLADRQVTSKRHAAMGGLEKAGLSAVAPLTAALHNGNAVVRANAAEMLGWLKPADAVTDLARLLSDPDPTVHAQAAWALGEIGTAPARLALNPMPILAPRATRALAPAPAVALAPLTALLAALADVWADYWPLATRVALVLLALLAILLIWRGPRPTSHVGPA
jgi:hypothetical protein